MRISLIPPNLIEVVWPQCEPLIQRVIDKVPDDITMRVTKDTLDTNEAMLVVISEGSTVIALNTLMVETLESGRRVLYIPITTGDRMEEWMGDFLEFATAMAKDLNCYELRGLAIRSGWLRKLKKYGWEESHVIIRCKLGE